jgi:hypothetical protein
VQLDLYTQIILSVIRVYQSANKSVCYNDTGWKFKINGCICYIEGCLVVYSVTESHFVRRIVAYVSLCVINTCHEYKSHANTRHPSGAWNFEVVATFT